MEATIWRAEGWEPDMARVMMASTTKLVPPAKSEKLILVHLSLSLSESFEYEMKF